jgi:cystathionine beta-synthase
MILDAEKNAGLKKGDIILEPTSGNTGIGLSLAAAARGYKMIITMPEKMSQEKRDVLTGLGAQIIRTPNHYGFDHPDCHIGIAVRLAKELTAEAIEKNEPQRAYMLDQYKNPSNPMAHYEGTGTEIWEQCGGKVGCVDYVFMGAGTAGTITGVSRKLKEMDSNIKIIGIDPFGSDLAEPVELNTPGPEFGYQVEGIGYDFIPRVADRQCVDEWIKSSDEPTFPMCRRLINSEGLLCGGSSGSAMAYAIKYIKEHKIGKGKRCVVVLADGVRNYMTKFLNADWMVEHKFMTEEQCLDLNTTNLVKNTDYGTDKKVKEMNLPDLESLNEKSTCEEAINMMKSMNRQQAAMRDANGNMIGVITINELMYRLSKKHMTLKSTILDRINRKFRAVGDDMPLNELVRVLIRAPYAAINGKSGKQRLVTSEDMVEFMTKGSQTEEAVKEVKAEVESAGWGASMGTVSLAVAAMGVGAFAYMKNNAN